MIIAHDPELRGHFIYLFGRVFSTDYEYYLAHQILPPIERLCDPIEGTDRARLAECLGMSLPLMM